MYPASQPFPESRNLIGNGEDSKQDGKAICRQSRSRQVKTTSVNGNSYPKKQNKSHQMEENWNFIKYLLGLKCYKTRNQKHEEDWKIHKYMETKQCTPQHLMGQRNQREMKTMYWNK